MKKKGINKAYFFEMERVKKGIYVAIGDISGNKKGMILKEDDLKKMVYEILCMTEHSYGDHSR